MHGKGRDRGGPHEPLIVCHLFNNNAHEPGGAPAVAPHNRILVVALLVLVGKVERLGVALAEVKDIPHLRGACSLEHPATLGARPSCPRGRHLHVGTEIAVLAVDDIVFARISEHHKLIRDLLREAPSRSLGRFCHEPATRIRAEVRRLNLFVKSLKIFLRLME